MVVTSITGFESLSRGTHQTGSGSVVSFHHNSQQHPHAGVDAPILCLTHGYPESSFIWRHVVPQLVSKYALFVPDQPGYGNSTPSAKGYDRLTVGTALVEAFSSVYPSDSENPKKVVLIGHDRGGRTMHRLAVDKDKFTHLEVIGLLVFDIVPYVAEWTAFSDPNVARGYFHWALLPNVELAVPMIMAYGGGKFCREIVERGAGPNAKGRDLLLNDGAVDAYVDFFDNEEVTRAAAEDYAAGAGKDYLAQKADQISGRKLEVPTFVVYSEHNLGKQFDVEKVWKDYITTESTLKVSGIGGDRGHFIVEEAPEECCQYIESFVADLI